MDTYTRPRKVISGGQTGADQGGLAGAHFIGLMTGGHMPRGFRTEHGPMPSALVQRYGMVEHPSPDYPPRTSANARNSDATVWFGATTSRGYQCTYREAVKRSGRPWIENPTPDELRAFCAAHRVDTLNVAGNSASKDGTIHDVVSNIIVETFGGDTE